MINEKLIKKRPQNLNMVNNLTIAKDTYLNTILMQSKGCTYSKENVFIYILKNSIHRKI